MGVTKKSKVSLFSFEPSDCKTMELWEKGWILALKNAGKNLQEIAELTTRSVDWCTNIVGALGGSDIEGELIRRYDEHMGRSGTGVEQETARANRRRNVYETKRNTNCPDNMGTIAGGLSGTRSGSRSDQTYNQPRQYSNDPVHHQSVIDKVRKSKDYRGDE
jgi:hypothetical protein